MSRYHDVLLFSKTSLYINSIKQGGVIKSTKFPEINKKILLGGTMSKYLGGEISQAKEGIFHSNEKNNICKYIFKNCIKKQKTNRTCYRL